MNQTDCDELTFWKALKLTKGQRTIVDVADLEKLSTHRWHATGPVQSTKKYYACTKIRPVPKANQKTLLLHRFLLDAEPGQEIDHVNGDTLDNRRINLRLTDRRGNQNNRADHSEYGPGIDDRRKQLKAHYPKGRPFRARVFIKGKLCYVGCFATAEEARAAREAYLKRAALAEEGE